MVTTRRQYLRGIGGGAALLVGAGCIGRAPPNGNDGDDADSENGDDSDDGGDEHGGTRPEGTGGPGVTIVSVDDDVDLPVVPSVEIVREAATESSPPRLRTTLENTRDEPVTVGEGRAVHLEHVTDETGALVFLPSEGEYPAEPGCWRLTEDVHVTEEYRTFEIDAGASNSRPVDLYATPGEDACLPVGEYRFETTVSVGPPESEETSSDRWGLTLLLE
ncbi:hypothetical protein GJ633_05555 [Halorubrum sp. CBA1125]|uniref:hypothetical protein n=1 Tax=Halorubrum sp. CBA1125 TaxID=2668072 RepID=UPI0012E9221B|nr:hypothetical protein [Halorubrum sp. CBA1125]MUW14181.1 hypothetical protein [Halorubrum sp. CBA1125]